MTRPFLSVVIPFHDRRATLPRCLGSVFLQAGFDDFEIVAVDDGSTDGGSDYVRSLDDPRLMLRSHPVNRGVCPARNTGIDAASGQWIVFLDSDDELAASDALARVASLARAAPDGLHALWFRCRLDDGSLSPDPMPAETDWDYPAYLRFLDASFGRPRDMIRAVRSACFDQIRYPDSRMLEEKFHLDFAKRFRSRLHGDVLRLYHQDAPNQLVQQIDRRLGAPDRARSRDRAIGLASLLREHAGPLRASAPRTHRELVRRAARQALQARLPVAAASALLAMPRNPFR